MGNYFPRERFYHSLNHFKSFTAAKFFVAPADNDYLLARWMFLNGFPEFFWHASQAIEKYLKAGLVLNGHNIKKASHNLDGLYLKHCEILKDVAFKELTAPTKLNPALWADQSVKDFIYKIGDFGSTNSRYGLTSYSWMSDDLYKLDQVCWALRRLSVGLDWVVDDDFPCGAAMEIHAGKTYREALTKDGSALPRSAIKKLDDKLHDLGPTRSDLLHSFNFSYRRNDSDISKPSPKKAHTKYGSGRNSYLSVYLEELERKNSDGKLEGLHPTFKEGMKWLIENIFISKEAKLDITRLMNAKRTQ